MFKIVVKLIQIQTSLHDFLQYFDLLKALAGHLEIDHRSIFEPNFFFANEMKKGYVFRGCLLMFKIVVELI